MATATTSTRQRNPVYLSIYQMRDNEKAHSPKCHTVTRGDKPGEKRQYQGICPEGDWVGSVTTGSKALLEMKKHAEDTRVAAQSTIDPALEELAAETEAEELAEAEAAKGEEVEEPEEEVETGS